MMIKTLLFALLATAAKAQTSTGSATGNLVFHSTTWDDWKWCCNDTKPGQNPFLPDSEAACPEACAAVHNPDNLAKYGPDSQFYKDEKAKLAAGEAVIDAVNDTSIALGFFNENLVRMKCSMRHCFKCGMDIFSACVSGDPHFKVSFDEISWH